MEVSSRQSWGSLVSSSETSRQQHPGGVCQIASEDGTEAGLQLTSRNVVLTG